MRYSDGLVGSLLGDWRRQCVVVAEPSGLEAGEGKKKTSGGRSNPDAKGVR
jgi:hypothetical protein